MPVHAFLRPVHAPASTQMGQCRRCEEQTESGGKREAKKELISMDVHVYLLSPNAPKRRSLPKKLLTKIWDQS